MHPTHWCSSDICSLFGNKNVEVLVTITYNKSANFSPPGNTDQGNCIKGYWEMNKTHQSVIIIGCNGVKLQGSWFYPCISFQVQVFCRQPPLLEVTQALRLTRASFHCFIIHELQSRYCINTYQLRKPTRHYTVITAIKFQTAKPGRKIQLLSTLVEALTPPIAVATYHLSTSFKSLHNGHYKESDHSIWPHSVT